jgi:hypothetical protein
MSGRPRRSSHGPYPAQRVEAAKRNLERPRATSRHATVKGSNIQYVYTKPSDADHCPGYTRRLHLPPCLSSPRMAVGLLRASGMFTQGCADLPHRHVLPKDSPDCDRRTVRAALASDRRVPQGNSVASTGISSNTRIPCHYGRAASTDGGRGLRQTLLRSIDSKEDVTEVGGTPTSDGRCSRRTCRSGN